MSSEIIRPDTLAALALVPEQLPGYVRGIAGSELRFSGPFPVYLARGESGLAAVLIGYPKADDPDLGRFVRPSAAAPDPEPDQAPGSVLDAAIAEVSGWDGVSSLSVLAPLRPASVPLDAPGYNETRDIYLAVDLPFMGAGEDFSGVPVQKLRNMLRRAARDVDLAVEPWSPELQNLAKSYGSSRALEAGTRYIFEHLEAYSALPGVQVFTARAKADGALMGLAIGDFTPYATAFYMFAFRAAKAAPGTADLLLHAVVAEAQKQGHERVNLGLSINGGIGFFKMKWRAVDFLPLVECSWPVPKKKQGFFKSLFS